MTGPLSTTSTLEPLYPSRSSFGSPGGSSEALDPTHQQPFVIPATIPEDSPNSSTLQLPQPPQTQVPGPSSKWPFKFRSPRGESATPSSSSTPVSDANLPSHILSKLNPANYVAVTRTNNLSTRKLFPGRNDFIKGTFTINPYLHVPDSLLPPFHPEGDRIDRPNLSLDVENGGIDVEIYVVGDPSPTERHQRLLRTTLYLSILEEHIPSNPGFPLTAIIHAPTLRPSFYLSAIALDGLLCIHLPRSFHGFIKVSRDYGDIDRHVSASRELTHRLALLSEVDRTRRYFVGEVNSWMESRQEKEWQGDEVDLRVREGKIWMQFVDERYFFRRVWSKAKAGLPVKVKKDRECHVQ